MVDPELLIRIDENVKYLRRTFDEHQQAFKEHITKDDKIIAEYIKPMWEDHQQNIGAAKSRSRFGHLGDKALTMGIAFATAWAALKGLK